MPPPNRKPAPQQERSRQTCERILAATEQLLRDRLFEQISVADIARTAKASVGSFYARFAKKTDLLPDLYRRYDAGLAREAQGLWPTGGWGDTPLQLRAERLIAFFADWFVVNRGLLRAIGFHSRQNPESLPADLIDRRRDLHKRVAGILLERRAEITHTDPEKAVEMGLFAVGAILREKLLFGGAPHARSISDDLADLERETTLLLMGYLCPNTE